MLYVTCCCFLHNFYCHDNAKHFSSSKVHVYQPYSHVLTVASTHLSRVSSDRQRRGPTGLPGPTSGVLQTDRTTESGDSDESVKEKQGQGEGMGRRGPQAEGSWEGLGREPGAGGLARSRGEAAAPRELLNF